jgi:hypothetical protein
MPRPKSMNEDVFRKVCDDIACGETIVDACKKNGTNARAYYEFMHDNLDNEDINKLSTRARQSKANNYWDKAEEVLHSAYDNKEAGVDINKSRFLFDGYLRLAGKANQGLYGDKQETIHTGSVTVMRSVKIGNKDLNISIGEDIKE